ncbi:MAG: hypothetical protein RIB60_11540 [Phycisphaerales bacterium]
MGLREVINSKPWLGWAVAGVAIAIGAFVLIRNLTTQEPDSVERRSQEVTIRCTETGTEWTMNRGEFERLLMTIPGEIDPSKGIPSPYAEGRLTGVLVDKDDWTEAVERINAAKRQFGG